MISTNDMLLNGWALVPIPPGEKGPKTKSWNLSENCITSISAIHVLQGKNIGLAHAYCKPYPTCAIDIDNYKHAKAWLNIQGIDLKNLLFNENSVVVWSGKKYSIKLLYSLPPGVKPLVSKKIVVDGKSALEFRCASKDGRTVMDVLPPSMHPNGTTYEWYGNGNPLLPPTLPQDLQKVWGKSLKPEKKYAANNLESKSPINQRPETPREVATIIAALNHISADCGYETWRNIVWAILSTGWQCADDLAFQWSQSVPHRFEEVEFWKLVNSYAKDHPSKITLGTLYHYARRGGWNG
jgi:putative DNA primase/helicase